MIIRNDLRKFAEKRLLGIKETVKNFDISFDKLTRIGLPSCWIEKGNIMSWKFYEDSLTLAKIKVDNRHEKTQILKGETVFNFLQRHFNLLWMVKTLFTERPTHSQVVAFMLEYHSFKNAPITQSELWKKCKTFSMDTAKGIPTSQPREAVDSATASEAAILID